MFKIIGHTSKIQGSSVIERLIHRSMKDIRDLIVGEIQSLQFRQEWEAIQFTDIIVAEIDGIELIQSGTQVLNGRNLAICVKERERVESIGSKKIFQVPRRLNSYWPTGLRY